MIINLYIYLQYVSSYTESPEQYFPMSLQNQKTSLAITPKSSFGLLTRILLGFKPLCDTPISKRNVGPSRIPCASCRMINSYPWQTGFESCIKILLAEWTYVFNPYGIKSKIINSIMMQLSFRQMSFTWTTLGWFNFIKNFTSFFISSSST